PGKGPHRAAAVLRLPSGALDAPADDERDRERVRDGAAADGEDQGVGDPDRVPDDGVQADAIGIAALASAQRLGAAGRRGQGDGVRGWGQERRRRLMKSSSTTIDNTPKSEGGALCFAGPSRLLHRPWEPDFLLESAA